MGLTPALDKITNLTNSISGINNKTTNFITIIDNISTIYNSFVTSADSVYSSFTNTNYTNAFYRPDFTIIPSVPSIYKSILGPKETNTTILGIFNAFMSAANTGLQ